MASNTQTVMVIGPTGKRRMHKYTYCPHVDAHVSPREASFWDTVALEQLADDDARARAQGMTIALHS